MIKEVWLNWLQEALKRLAESGANQAAYLKNRGVWPDELALEFDDVAGLLPEAVRKGEISKESGRAVNRVLSAALIYRDHFSWERSWNCGYSTTISIRGGCFFDNYGYGRVYGYLF